MKISKSLLTTIATSVILGGAMTSCVGEKVSIEPEIVCEDGCELDHKHIESPESTNYHAGDCPACGMG